MSYDTYIARRQARIVRLLETNPSVREFIAVLTRTLAAHASTRGQTLERVVLDEPVVLNHTTGDEVLRARILLRG